MTTFERIETLCEERGITKRQLSLACGFNASSISKWKQHTPSVTKLQKVADYFDVSTAWLLGESDVRINEQRTYYNDDETAILTQGLSDDQRTLMKAVPNLPPKRVKLLLAMVEQFSDGNE